MQLRMQILHRIQWCHRQGAKSGLFLHKALVCGAANKFGRLSSIVHCCVQLLQFQIICNIVSRFPNLDKGFQLFISQGHEQVHDLPIWPDQRSNGSPLFSVHLSLQCLLITFLLCVFLISSHSGHKSRGSFR